MSKSAACPKCQGPLDLSQRNADGRIVCGGCGAKLKVQRPQPKPTKAPTEEPATPSANPHKAPTDEQPLDSNDLLDPLQTGEASASSDDDWLDEDFKLSDPVTLPSESHSKDLAPRPRAPASKHSEDADKKRKERLLQVGLLAGGGVLTLGLVVLMVSLLVGRSSDSASGTDASAKGNSVDASDGTGGSGLWAVKWEGGEIPSQPVSFNTPVPQADDADDPVVPSSPLEKAEPFDEAAHEPQINPAVEEFERKRRDKPSEEVVEPETFDDAPCWLAEADPSPADADYEIAAGLEIKSRGPDGLFQVRRAADRGGPFLLLPPSWEKVPTTNDYQNDEESSEDAFTPIEVLDIRTGEIAGVFDWRIPIRWQGVLGPDGKYFLGSYHIPHMNTTTERDEEIRKKLNSLYVWERDSDQPPRQLSVGYASWFGFVDARTAVMLIEYPTRELQFWDVTTGEQQSGVELPPDDRYYRADLESDPNLAYGVLMQQYHNRNDVAISPGGRFAAVVTGATITMISIEDAKILGTTQPFLTAGQEASNARRSVQGLSFTPQGTEIVVVYPTVTEDGRQGSTHLLKLSAVDGRRLIQQGFPSYSDAPRGWGPLFPGQSEGTWIQTGRKSYRRGTNSICYQFGTDSAVRLPVQEILQVPRTGPVLVDGWRLANDEQPTVFALDRNKLERMIAIARGGPLGAAVAVDRSSQRLVEPEPPSDWQPLTGMGRTLEGDCTQLPAPPRYTCWGDEHVGALVSYRQSKEGARSVDCWWMIDRATGRPAQKPVQLRYWAKWWSLIKMFRTLAMSRDGSLLVLNDPTQLDRLEVFSTDGTWRYGFRPFEGENVVVEWTGFDAEDRLLVAGGGAIARFELGDQSVAALFQTENTHYLPPFKLGPAKKRLIASRGHSLDVLDAVSGQILNRLGINWGTRTRTICDFAFSPDGKHAAAVDNVGGVGIWNLETGEAFKSEGGSPTYAPNVAWAANDLLLFGGNPVNLLDLRLGVVTLEYKLAIYRAFTSNRLGTMGLADGEVVPPAVAPDGRFWKFVGMTPDKADALPEFAELGGTLISGGHVPFWKTAAVSDEVTESEAPFFADDRQVVLMHEQPLQLTIDIGDRKLAEANADRVLQELQSRGFTIGPDGLVLHVDAGMSESKTLVSLGGQTGRRARVPKIDYVWSLRDSAGTVLWSTTISVDPEPINSRYLKEDWRRDSVPDSSRVEQLRADILEKFDMPANLPNDPTASPFDFRGMPMREAFAKEMLEKEFEIPEEFPTGFMKIGDKYAQLPAQLEE